MGVEVSQPARLLAVMGDGQAPAPISTNPGQPRATHPSAQATVAWAAGQGLFSDHWGLPRPSLRQDFIETSLLLSMACFYYFSGVSQRPPRLASRLNKD
jgi:hypothetical protein